MKIFLDVGAHIGETLEAVLDPRYRFDKIVCFEPVPACCRRLARFKDPRVEICEFGLWKDTCELPIYDPGGLGATVFSDHAGPAQELCRFVKAGDWFSRNLSTNDRVFMKLNCEGSECDIIDDLLSSGEIRKLRAFMIDFDAYKLPSQKHRPRQLLERLAVEGITNFSLSHQVMIGPTHMARIQNWLRLAHGEERLPSNLPNDIRYIYFPLAVFRALQFIRFFGPRSLLRRFLSASAYSRVKLFYRRIIRERTAGSKVPGR